MSATGTSESNPKKSFKADLKFAIYYMNKVLNESDFVDLDNLDQYIKDLKLNLNLAKSKGYKVTAEVDLAQNVLRLDDHVRTLKTEQHKNDVSRVDFSRNFIKLNDEINEIKVKVDQYYLQIEKATPAVNRPSRPKG